MEHPLNPHKSYAYSPPPPLCRTATGSGRAAHLALTTPRLSPYADASPHAADLRAAAEGFVCLSLNQHLASHSKRATCFSGRWL